MNDLCCTHSCRSYRAINLSYALISLNTIAERVECDETKILSKKGVWGRDRERFAHFRYLSVQARPSLILRLAKPERGLFN